MRLLLITFSIVVFTFGCNQIVQKNTNKLNTRADLIYNTSLKYARGFKLKYNSDTIAEVKIFFLPDTLKPIASYSFCNDTSCLILPVRSFAINSTTWLPFFTLLGADEFVKGFSGLQYITDTIYTNKIVKNQLKEISNGREIDMEKLLALSPQVLMTYPFEGDKTPNFKKYNIQNIYNADYLENTPLGRTEWIKFIGLLTGKGKQADSIFNVIENQYIEIKKSANTQVYKPSIFTNRPYKGVWYVQGGNSFAANFIKDAGGNYVFADSNINNVYPMDFEFVFNKAVNADVWLIMSHDEKSFSLKELLKEDHRYKHFKAVKTGNIIYCNTSQNQYFEKASAEPHVVLKDITHFLHPNLLPNHKPVYFKKLE